MAAGVFSHSVHHRLDHDFDLSGFDARYHKDANVARAYPPGMLRKRILYDKQGLIGRQGFAIDGMKPRSNAAKASRAKRDTWAEFGKHAGRREEATRWRIKRLAGECLNLSALPGFGLEALFHRERMLGKLRRIRRNDQRDPLGQTVEHHPLTGHHA